MHICTSAPIEICSCSDLAFWRKINLFRSRKPECVQRRTHSENVMARCLLGVFVLTVGLIALASANRGASTFLPPPVPSDGPRLSDTEAIALSGVSRTLLRPLPVLNMSFSLN